MILAGALLAIAGAAVLAVRWRRDQVKERRRRAGFFAGCENVLHHAAITERRGDFPRLAGTWRGRGVSVVPVVEGLAPRKLPSLWLLITMHAPGRGGATLDIIMRPLGVEFYSPSAELPFRMETPVGWPPHAVIKTDAPDALPGFDWLRGAASLLADPRAKEVLLAPDKVRIVWQGAEADRGNYLTLRQARFPDARLDPLVLRQLLDILLPLAAPQDVRHMNDTAWAEVVPA